MNSRIKLCILSAAILGCLHGSLQAQQSGKVKMRDSASHDSLSQKLRMAQQVNEFADLGPAKGNTEVDPSVENSKRDLIKSSTIIAFNGRLTLVPKRAVLHIPEKLEDRIGEKPNVQVQNFQDFYKYNRGWIRTMEVTRPQALGHVPFDEETLTAIKESSSLVVATYKGGPISVLPPKDPETVPTKSEMKPITFQK
jgi:hypothetical protein